MGEVVTSCTALRPNRELRLINDVFTENIAELDCRYIKDEKLMVLKDAIKQKDRAERVVRLIDLGAALLERHRGEGGGTAGWTSTAEPRHSGRQAVSPQTG